MEIALEDNKIVTKVEYDVNVVGEEKAQRQIAQLEKRLNGLKANMKIEQTAQAKRLAGVAPRGYDRNLIGSKKTFRPKLFNENSIASRSSTYGPYRQPTPLLTRPNESFGRNKYSGMFNTLTGEMYLDKNNSMMALKEFMKKTKKKPSGTGGVASRNNMGGLDGLVGKAMLYMGFASLGAYAVSSVGNAMYSAGQMAGDVELEMMKGRALSSIYGSSANEAVGRYSSLTGNKDYMSRSILAQVASPLEAAGKKLSSKDLTKVSEILYGMEYGLGRTKEISVQSLSNVLAGKTTLKEAGFANVKKGSNETETLNNIYEFLKKNKLTSSIMQERTMKAIMNEITTSPTNIFSNLMSTSSKQMKRTFGDIADEMNKMFGGSGANQGQQGMWGNVLGQFEYSVAGALKQYGPDITKGLTNLAISLSLFAGESIKVMGLISKYTNPETFVKLGLGYMALKAPIVRKGIKSAGELIWNGAKLDAKLYGESIKSGAKVAFGAVKSGAKVAISNPIVSAPVAFGTALGVAQHRDVMSGKYDWKDLMDEDLRRNGYSDYTYDGSIQNGKYQINATNIFLNKDGIETDIYINEEQWGAMGGVM